MCEQCDTEIEIDIEIDKEIDIEIEKEIENRVKGRENSGFAKHKYGEYKNVVLADDELKAKLFSPFKSLGTLSFELTRLQKGAGCNIKKTGKR